MINTLPINIDDLLHRRTVESERIEYKASWNPETVLHTLCAFANDFHNLGGGYVVIGVAEENGSPEPLFETDDARSYFLIRLPIHTRFQLTPQVKDGKTIEIKKENKNTPQDTPQDTPQVLVLLGLFENGATEQSKTEMMTVLGLKDDKHFRRHYLLPALNARYIEMTMPDKPTSRNQKYRLTVLGQAAIGAQKRAI